MSEPTPISTEELVARIKATVEAADAKGAFQTAVPLPMLLVISKRIEALVRLTAAQKVEIDGLKDQVAAAGNPARVVISIKHHESPTGEPDFDVAVIRTRNGNVIAICDEVVEVWKTNADFETGKADRALAIVKLTP